MMGKERSTLYKAKRELERAGIPTATGSRFWREKAIREYIREDVYNPSS
jgi:hypothetical protein